MVEYGNLRIFIKKPKMIGQIVCPFNFQSGNATEVVQGEDLFKFHVFMIQMLPLETDLN